MIPKGLPGEGNILIFDNGAGQAMDYLVKPPPMAPRPAAGITPGY
ncbi:hypothetical protein N752_12030 [Desulforamulus aquiferis]|nr:hypothetical protein N752_12030 [Desulforamulus aquiferis]